MNTTAVYTNYVNENLNVLKGRIVIYPGAFVTQGLSLYISNRFKEILNLAYLQICSLGGDKTTTELGICFS